MIYSVRTERGLGRGICRVQRNFKILEDEDLHARRSEVVSGVTSVLDVEEELAVKLLRLYKW